MTTANPCAGLAAHLTLPVRCNASGGFFFGTGATMAEAVAAGLAVHRANGWTNAQFVDLTPTATGWQACFQWGRA